MSVTIFRASLKIGERINVARQTCHPYRRIFVLATLSPCFWKSVTFFRESLKIASELIIDTYSNKGKVILAGNGGSASDSQHICAEFVGRFNFDRPSLPAIALTGNSSNLTCISNDYGYNNVFSRQITAPLNLFPINLKFLVNVHLF